MILVSLIVKKQDYSINIIEVTKLKTVLIITSAIVVLRIQLAVEVIQINIYQFAFKLLFSLPCIL